MCNRTRTTLGIYVALLMAANLGAQSIPVESVAVATIDPVKDQQEDRSDNESIELLTDERALSVKNLEVTHLDNSKFRIRGLPAWCDIKILDESGMIQFNFASGEEAMVSLDLNGLPSGPYFFRAKPKAADGSIYTGYIMKLD